MSPEPRIHHAELVRQLDPLEACFDQSGRAEARLASLKADIEGVKAVLAGLESRLDEVRAIPDGIAEIAPDDKRRTRDMRREHVVRSCCYIWTDAGRTVSYTTVSIGTDRSKRRGPLIDLVTAVALLVTDPPTPLSGETIRRDIDRFKRLRKLRLI